jgi:hypothetical protein
MSGETARKIVTLSAQGRRRSRSAVNSPARAPTTVGRQFYGRSARRADAPESARGVCGGVPVDTQRTYSMRSERPRTARRLPGGALRTSVAASDLASRGAHAERLAAFDARYNQLTRLLNRPGFCGDSEPTKGWSHASTKEVSERVP